jgi:exosortase
LKLHWSWLALLGASFLVAYAPTIASLQAGPWRTEQESHGPLIMLTSLWLAWRSWPPCDAVAPSPAPRAGWLTLSAALALLWISRTQGLLGGEVLSGIVAMSGCTLIIAGRGAMHALGFPIAFLAFAIPLPDWVVDSLTLPLKVFISDAVTAVLHAAGYPIAHDGVVILIGTYQLLVKDACSGLNSIFALLAVGLLYMHLRRHTFWGNFTLLLAIIPIAVIANFMRVLCLVLIAYYGGSELLDGPLHWFTGLAMFGLAAAMLFFIDLLLPSGSRERHPKHCG